MPITERRLLGLLQSRQPVKARELAKILKDEFQCRVDTSDVNSKLYALNREGKVAKNDSYHWYIPQSDGSDSAARQDDLPSKPEISFTRDQQALIDLDPSGHLLIRGQAGSGKTTVLAARAGQILSAMDSGSLLFLTYNSALSARVRRDLDETSTGDRVHVTTFHDWARKSASELGATFTQWIDGKKRKDALKPMLDAAQEEMGEHRLYDYRSDRSLVDWYSDEIAWLFGQHIRKLSDYAIVERSGRGTLRRLRRDERQYVWTVFEMYEEWLEVENSADYDNPAGLVLRSLEQGDGKYPDSLIYDHVMIDEVQDFDRSWLLAVMPSVRVSLAVAGDLAQRIYRRNFTWSSVGINVQGSRSKVLDKCFRSTRQVLTVAEYLLIDNDVKHVPDYVRPSSSNRDGEKVFKLEGEDARSAYSAGYEWIANKFGKEDSGTVVVALPFSNQIYPAKKQLEKLGLVVDAARGKTLGEGRSRIVTTTFHQLKGLEFDHVVMFGLNDDQFPGRLLKPFEVSDSGEDESYAQDLKQESDRLRRLLYVAMTRSKCSTTLVGSREFCRYFDDVPSWLFNDIENQSTPA